MELQGLPVRGLAPCRRGRFLSGVAEWQPNAAEQGGLGWRFWRLVPLVGLVAGLATAGLMTLLNRVEGLAWGNGAGSLLDRIRDTTPTHRLLVLVVAGAIAAALAAILRIGPGGHGGELAESIWFRAGRLPPWRTLAKAVVSIVIVGMGASLGREAAAKQVGALWAWLLAHWTGLPAPQRRLLSACGAGAGIAAVYNVPIGGALFALEVLLGELSLPLVPPALLASGIATATAWLVLPDAPTYHVPVPVVSPSLIGFALLVGPPIGLAAALYVRLIAFADRCKPAGWLGAAAPLAVFAALGLLGAALPELLGNGKDEVQAIFTGGLPLLPLLGLAALKSVATASCLGSGAPGGLFTPTITEGAALSGLLERAWHWAWPGSAIGPGAMLGAGAFLAASTAGPVSAAVFILELTGQIGGLVAPLAIAVAGAVVVSRRLERRSIYSCRIHLARARSAMPHAATLFTAARYPEVLSAFVAHAWVDTVSVVDERGQPIGEIPRAGLTERAGQLHPLRIATARDLSGQ